MLLSTISHICTIFFSFYLYNDLFSRIQQIFPNNSMDGCFGLSLCPSLTQYIFNKKTSNLFLFSRMKPDPSFWFVIAIIFVTCCYFYRDLFSSAMGEGPFHSALRLNFRRKKKTTTDKQCKTMGWIHLIKGALFVTQSNKNVCSQWLIWPARRVRNISEIFFKRWFLLRLARLNYIRSLDQLA